MLPEVGNPVEDFVKHIAFLGFAAGALFVGACDGPAKSVSANSPLASNGPEFSTSSTASFRRVDLGTLGGESSYATDMNGQGTVVGWSQIASGAAHAFRWTARSGIVDLGTLPGDEWSRAVSIRDKAILNGGRILGISGNASGWRPVVWSSSGAVVALSIPLLPGSTFGYPVDFNEAGQVIGWDALVLQHAWIWSESQGKYDITANVPGGSFEGTASQINPSGLVVGTNHARTCVRTPECPHAFLWSAQSGYRDLGIPGTDPETNLSGLGLNSTGTVVGWVSGNAGSTSPYRWKDNRFTLLPTFSHSGYGYGVSVNIAGAAAGASIDPRYGTIQAAAWPKGGGIVKLSPGDPHASLAVVINDAGAVAGWSSLATGQNHATLWTPGSDKGSASLSVDAGSPAISRSVTASPAAPCLTDTRALGSRQALFACIVENDRRKR